MLSGLAIWLVFLVTGIAVLLPLYAGLLKDIERHCPDHFEAMGRPSLFMYSPARGIRLQRFIYGDARRTGIHPAVAARCRALGILTPVFVVLVFAGLAWVVLDLLPAL